jgi:hypothetical protein
MRRSAPLVLVSICIACAEPPVKEMNQAETAIDAARTAGAEQFAATELTAAVDALRRSEEAVTARDYRLALNYAIESRDRAHNAARAAGSERSRTRGEIEALLAEATTMLAHAREQFRAAERARPPRRASQAARDTIADAEKAVQNARTWLESDDFVRAREALAGVSARIQTAIGTIGKATDGAAARKRR